MALRIRLARGGTKKRPHYNIVVSDSRSPRNRPPISVSMKWEISFIPVARRGDNATFLGN